MTEDTAVAEVPANPAIPLRRRVRAGLPVSGNWLRLATPLNVLGSKLWSFSR